MTKWNPKLYDDKHQYVSNYGLDLLEKLRAQAGEQILDLGCGTGDLSAEISKNDAMVTSVDLDSEMIEAAKAKYPHIYFTVADAETLVYKNEFDAVFSNAAMHWMPNQAQVIENLYTALKTGGRVVVELGGEHNIASIYQAMKYAFDATGIFFNPAHDPWTFPSADEMEGYLKAAGFKNIALEHFERPTFLSGPDGLANWLDMFSNTFFKDVSDSDKTKIYEHIEDYLRPSNFQDGKWLLDYWRLRFYAEK